LTEPALGIVKHVAVAVLLLPVAAGPALGQARAAPDDALTPGVLRACTDEQIRGTAWGRVFATSRRR
jgi:hypothetical protein